MPSPQRVLSRYLEASVIGDIRELTAAFEADLQGFEVSANQIQAVQEYVTHTIEKQESELAREYERMVSDNRAKYEKRPVSGGPNLFEDVLAEWQSGTPKTRRDTAYTAKALRLTGFQQLKRQGHSLFLAIIQQLSLPPVLGRKVQAASRYWSKTKLAEKKEPRHWAQYLSYVQEPALFLAELGTWREHLALARDCVVKGVPHGEAQDTTTKVGPFTLINTGNFKPAVMENVKELVEKATKYLTQVGLGKICYGDVHITKTISRGNVLAFYMVDHDEMFIRANVDLNEKALLTIIHELAHRLEKQFLRDRKDEIVKLYDNLKYTASNAARETVGWPELKQEVVVKGKPCEVVSVIPAMDRIQIKEKPDPANPTKRLNSYTADIEWWAENVEGKAPERTPKFKGFISTYASKDPSENFAEMVSLYAIGKLPKPLVDMLEPIIR